MEFRGPRVSPASQAFDIGYTATVHLCTVCVWGFARNLKSGDSSGCSSARSFAGQMEPALTASKL